MIQKPLFWHQGLFLQPQHFQMLERSLHGALAPFNEYAVPSFWGIADMDISRTALANRSFDLLRGIFLFPDGTYIELPGNAVIKARSFDGERAGTLNVHLGLKRWNDYGENVTVLTQGDDISAVPTRYCAADNPEEINDLHGGGPAGQVRRITHVMKIMWESEIAQAGDYVTMQIAQLTKSGADVRLADDYIPPSLNISGPLLKLMAEVRDQLTSRSFQLEEYKKKRGVHSAEFGSRDMVYILALRTLARYVPLLYHFIETKKVHPWSVYGTLKQLIGELSVFSETVNVLGEVGAGRRVVPPYDHGQLEGCFSAVQEMISHLLDELTAGADYIIRLKHDGSYYSADLRPSIFEGHYRFYLSFKTEETPESVIQAVKSVVKVGSREGLRVIVSRALPGITLEHDIYIPRDPQSGLGSGKRIHGPLTIVKEYDKSSPKIYQALCTGEHLKDVTIKWYRINKQGSEEHYFTHKLEDAIVVSVKPFMPMVFLEENEAFRHMEEVSFTYKKIKWTWEVDGIESEDSWAVPR